MAPSSESGTYRAIAEVERKVAVIENEQKHFVGAVEALSITVKDLRDTVAGLKVKVGIIIGIASVVSAIVTNIVSGIIAR